MCQLYVDLLLHKCNLGRSYRGVCERSLLILMVLLDPMVTQSGFYVFVFYSSIRKFSKAQLLPVCRRVMTAIR